MRSRKTWINKVSLHNLHLLSWNIMQNSKGNTLFLSIYQSLTDYLLFHYNLNSVLTSQVQQT